MFLTGEGCRAPTTGEGRRGEQGREASSAGPTVQEGAGGGGAGGGAAEEGSKAREGARGGCAAAACGAAGWRGAGRAAGAASLLRACLRQGCSVVPRQVLPDGAYKDDVRLCPRKQQGCLQYSWGPHHTPCRTASHLCAQPKKVQLKGTGLRLRREQSSGTHAPILRCPFIIWGR